MGKAIYKNGEYVLDTPDLIEQPVEPIKKNTAPEQVEPTKEVEVETEKK